MGQGVPRENRLKNVRTARSECVRTFLWPDLQRVPLGRSIHRFKRASHKGMHGRANQYGYSGVILVTATRTNRAAKSPDGPAIVAVQVRFAPVAGWKL